MKLSKYRILISGTISPLAALFLYALVYATLPGVARILKRIGCLVSWVDPRDDRAVSRHAGSRDKGPPAEGTFPVRKIGLAIAILSLGLAWKPVSDGITRSKQSRNQAMDDVAAPAFDTVDILGKTQRLGDHKGEVVLVNIWATWCGPCRREMPKLDHRYQEQKNQGFIVFGLSDETVDVQKKFLEQVPVSYPLLTPQGDVPNLYRDIARYPAIFLIDCQGDFSLHPTRPAF